MEYSKYNDVSAMLSELCLPFSDKEFEILAYIGAKMGNNPAFDKAYTAEIRNLYFENINALKNYTYAPQKFEKLNLEVCKKICGPHKSVTKSKNVSDKENMSEKQEQLHDKIATLRKRTQN